MRPSVWLVGISLLMVSGASAQTFESRLRRYEAEIRQQEKQLRSLKLNLKRKEEKAAEWKSMADSAKRRWEQMAASVKWAQSQWKAAQQTYAKTTSQVQTAQWQSATQQRLTNFLTDELTQLSGSVYMEQKLRPIDARADLMAEERRQQMLHALSATLPQAQQQSFEARELEATLKKQAQRWKNEQTDRQNQSETLQDLRNSQRERWQDAQRRRQLLLEEVAQAEQSAQALQVMLTQLRKSRDAEKARTATAAAPASSPAAQTMTLSVAENSSLMSLRGNLPWPAAGEVKQSFGKQFSEELQQLLVSNGIRVQASADQAVRAVQPGVVLFARAFHQYGQMVVVQHSKGLASVYAGLGTVAVREGDSIADLQTVGRTGETGRYYFELRQEERPLDPMRYLISSSRRPS